MHPSGPVQGKLNVVTGGHDACAAAGKTEARKRSVVAKSARASDIAPPQIFPPRSSRPRPQPRPRPRSQAEWRPRALQTSSYRGGPVFNNLGRDTHSFKGRIEFCETGHVYSPSSLFSSAAAASSRPPSRLSPSPGGGEPRVASGGQGSPEPGPCGCEPASTGTRGHDEHGKHSGILP
jgi:hypothetical protein